MRIIYVDVDTLRPDHTEPYGYARKITPNLGRLAEKSVVFDQYFCTDSPCLPSRAALTSQQFGAVSGVIGHFGAAAQMRFPRGNTHDPDRPLLGGHLDANGIYPASISCFAERHLAYWFHGNFRESIRPTRSSGNDEDAKDVNDAAIDWLTRRARADNWFLHVNYWEPHTDYVEPVSWLDRAAAAGPAPAWPDEATIARHQELYGPRSASDLHYCRGARTSPRPQTMPDAIRNRADFELLVNGYDGAIAYWDHRFGELLDALDRLGIAEETAIIVSADHGECLGENGVYGEHGLANDPTHRVPMIIYWPGITDRLSAEQRHSDALLYNIDLGPTLCELLGIPTPAGWHGTSFAPAVNGDSIPGRRHLILSHGAHTYQRAVRTREHLYVRTLHPGCYGMDWEQLYDVTQDPQLTSNLIHELPAVADQLKARLLDWWHTYLGAPGALADPMQTTLDVGPALYNPPAEYLHHLEETGRQHQAHDLRRRLAAWQTGKFGA